MSYKMHILVCGGTGCRASASHQIITRLEECLKEKNLEDEVQVIATGCFGFCEKGPIVKVMPDNTFYVQVKPDDAEEIVNEHVIKGRKVERLLYKDPEKKEAFHQIFYCPIQMKRFVQDMKLLYPLKCLRFPHLVLQPLI